MFMSSKLLVKGDCQTAHAGVIVPFGCFEVMGFWQHLHLFSIFPNRSRVRMRIPKDLAMTRLSGWLSSQHFVKDNQLLPRSNLNLSTDILTGFCLNSPKYLISASNLAFFASSRYFERTTEIPFPIYVDIHIEMLIPYAEMKLLYIRLCCFSVDVYSCDSENCCKSSDLTSGCSIRTRQCDPPGF